MPHAPHDRLISRRSVLRRGSGAALGVGLGSLLPHAHALSTPPAALATAHHRRNDRALVCVFLSGGNDNGNTVIPFSGSANGQDHAYYATARSNLALPKSVLRHTQITPANTGGRVFALHPELMGLAELFASGALSVVANVGSLTQPTTKAQYQSGSIDLPPQLFAHHAQQTLWQIATSHGEMGTRVVVPDRSVMHDGHTRPTALRPLAREALGLTRQLDTVARLIEHGPSALTPRRHVFFVTLEGFDHHHGLIADAKGNRAGQETHGQRLAELNQGLTHFWSQLGQLGMRDQVTTFTASDFGRTLKSNGRGSDHGWGGHHFVMGGRQLARGPAAALGTAPQDRGMMFGTFNDLELDGPDDVGNGRYIPTTSVDEYAHDVARWMGVTASDMPAVLPNLHRFQDHRAPLNMLN